MMPCTDYPLTLTEVERVEIASALSYHFEDDCRGERKDQYDVVCVVVERMMRRRAGVA
jgi:hypothetical protein